jgi:hypothetical protein
MYEIGSVQDFCTSIAFSQNVESPQDNLVGINNNGTKIANGESINVLARNLDYGFQRFLTNNTFQLNFYKSRALGLTKSNLKYTTVSHPGFVGTHTLLKYKGDNNIKFGLSLN